jgi:hypothetical protein
MDLSPGYDLAPAWIDRLKVLDWIYDNGGNSGAVVELDPLLAAPEWGTAKWAELRNLQDKGWVEPQRNPHKWILTPAGIDFIENIRRLRGDPIGRRKAARDAVLRWLYASKVGGVASPDISNLATSPYRMFYGHAFTEHETTDATAWLKEEGYLNGKGAWGGVIARPGITTKGERLVESGRSVNDVVPASGAAHAPVTVKVKASRNVNINTNSPGATQSVTITEDNRRQVVNVADALEGMLGALGLDATRTTEAQAIVRDLREVSAETSPEPGRLRQLLDKAASVAIAGTGTAAGSALVALIAEAVKGLGGG